MFRLKSFKTSRLVLSGTYIRLWSQTFMCELSTSDSRIFNFLTSKHLPLSEELTIRDMSVMFMFYLKLNNASHSATTVTNQTEEILDKILKMHVNLLRHQNHLDEKKGLILSYLTNALPYIEPEFLPTPSNVTYSKGELAILFCAVKNLGSKFVSWRRTSDPNPLTVGAIIYSPDNRIHINNIEYRNEWNLYIKNVSNEDAGIYECQVSIKMRDMRKYTILNVIEPLISTSPVYKKKNIGKLSSNTKRGTDRTDLLRKSSRNKNGCAGVFVEDSSTYTYFLFIFWHVIYHFVVL